MGAGDSKKTVRALTVFQSADLRKRVNNELQRHYRDRLEEESVPLLQDAVALVEEHPERFDLLIIEHESASLAVLKTLLDLCGFGAPVLVSNKAELFEGLLARERPPEVARVSSLEQELEHILRRLVLLGRLPPTGSVDSLEYVAISSSSLMGVQPLHADVFVKIGDGHFVRVFKQGEVIVPEALQKFIESKKDKFHLKKSGALKALDQTASGLRALASPLPQEPEKAAPVLIHARKLVGDLIAQVGFTPEAREIARNSAMVAIRLVGSKPKLASVLKDINLEEGGLIANHSFVTGNVACALAFRAGWSSESTFFKLWLAAFLHDIAIHREEHAKFRTSAILDASELDSDQAREVRLHPIRAGEYARQFTDIPSDVEQIVVQHHERPDGGGFPRALHSRHISPLSALFIIAEDLVHAAIENPGLSVLGFFETKKEEYSRGQFRKIRTSILGSGSGL